ncbi:TPA: acetylglutamate kinase [bacterium]|nr:acetylglutamate kinase [bacterium]
MIKTKNSKLIERAEVLVEALPYIKEFYGKYIVIKYGGSAMVEDELRESFAIDCVLLKYVGIKPVVVHGGGHLISKVMTRMGMEVKFQDGLRITDSESMEAVEMVLGGRINTEIVSLLNKHGAKAIGLSGAASNMILAKPIDGLGFVGEVLKIAPEPLHILDDSGFLPIIAPIGIDEGGRRYNINADTVAGKVAINLSAEKLIVLTDTKGIYDGKKFLSTVKAEDINRLIEKGSIKSGMIPKAKAAVDAVLNGVKKTHIIDGRVKHSILLELFTDSGIGTQVVSNYS